MDEVKDYQSILAEALEKAAAHIQDGDDAATVIQQYPELNKVTYTEKDKTRVVWKNIAFSVETIVRNLNQNKYLFSILVTALATKIVSPHIDIRNHQAQMPDGYSNRSADQVHVTPFLKKHTFTHCAASGMESGRNFERPLPLRLDFPSKPRGEGNREATLGIFHAVQEENVNPLPILIYLFYQDLSAKKSVIYTYPAPQGLTVQQIIDAIVEHFEVSQGHGKSRLPVLAMQAMYECIILELKRYAGKTLVSVARHTANDKKGSTGDIQVNHASDKPFEGVEVKSGKQITAAMIKSIPIKLQDHAVERYYLLSTEEIYIHPLEKFEVMNVIAEIRSETGCEIIANGLIRSLWYYLRLITDKDSLLKSYTRLLQEDQDVREPQREAWSKILNQLGEIPDQLRSK